MSDSSCSRQRARSSIFIVSEKMNSLKVPLRVLVDSTSWVGRSGRVTSYFHKGELVNFFLVPISKVPFPRYYFIHWLCPTLQTTTSCFLLNCVTKFNPLFGFLPCAVFPFLNSLVEYSFFSNIHPSYVPVCMRKRIT
jgi:hypothetical protein